MLLPRRDGRMPPSVSFPKTFRACARLMIESNHMELAIPLHIDSSMTLPSLRWSTRCFFQKVREALPHSRERESAKSVCLL
jgi:hypothetical protein